MSQSAQPPRQSSPRQPDAETLPAPGVVLDPADQAVITQALLAAANEMGAKLIRSAHSPIVREASDCSTALLDLHGNMVSQAELVP